MIDPPGGYLYGFPKVFDAPDGTSIEDWLLARGYPRREIEAFSHGVPCRVYYVTTDSPERE